ncbi:hypothetical protein WMW72_24225 [Paenibacillus filicis]|uniref:Uncharacterized protein n=1 Tax=Paenibacillus filicis TaxID=669464 RepID=A0ABU9DQ95_9BACL
MRDRLLKQSEQGSEQAGPGDTGGQACLARTKVADCGARAVTEAGERTVALPKKRVARPAQK